MTVAANSAEVQAAATDDDQTGCTEANETNGGSVAAVRLAVSAQVNDELDKCTRQPTGDVKMRAARYVATVRPTMATQRYQWRKKTEDKDDDRRRTESMTKDTEANRSTAGEDGDGTHNVLLTGEDGELTKETMEEDDTPANNQSGADSQEAEWQVSMSVATIRRVRRRSRRAAKQRRVQRALEKEKTDTTNDEVERVVAELAEEQLIRREKQAAEARHELAERWQRGDDEGHSEAAQVSLVREMKVQTAVDGDTHVIEEAEASDGLPTALMTIDGQQRAVKIDSGARYSVAGTDWMMRGERVKKKAPVTHVEGIGGFLLDVLGLWKFEMTNTFGQPVTIMACIVEGCVSEFLVGIDFLEGHRATLDFECGEVRYEERGREIVIPFSTNDEEGSAASVRVARATKLVQRSVQPIEVAVAAQEGEEGVFIPTHDTGTVLMAAAVTKVHNGKALVPAINAHGGRVKLPTKKELGIWVPLGKDMETLTMSGELKADRVRDWLSKLGNTETPLDNEEDIQIGIQDKDARDLVTRLIRSYRTLTEAPKDCPPATTLEVEHHIDTGNASPILMKRRRQAQTEDATINENVDSMLKAGVIEESSGAWGFPVVLVKKKDGSVRFCVDYRALNSVTKRDVYPLPRIDETLEALGGARLFTTLDLQAGYWQITVARGDRDKTAFLTKRGLYRFRRMPFGLTNAPATFQRLMNGVLRGLTWTTCLVYLDDIVIFTKGEVTQHVVEVAGVLERLASAGLSLKLKKCTFATESMEYLGHTLSAQGVQPTERLIGAVTEFPRPTDATEVKRFVHLAGYYRKFIAGFGSIAAPMTRLLKKDSVWQWTEEQEVAFERIKNLLTTKPLLHYPDFGRPFRLVTDASKVGLGACLMQDYGHGWQPVAFASKVNSNAEANYSITELECLAVVWAVKLFRPYLYGRTFTIVTDHSALKWLMTRPNLAGRLHRWSLTLQEYDFCIEYRPGSTNVVADALSRAPTTNALSSAPAAVRAVIQPSSERIAPRYVASGDRAARVTNTANETADITGTTDALTSETATTHVRTDTISRTVPADATNPFSAGTPPTTSAAEGMTTVAVATNDMTANVPSLTNTMSGDVAEDLARHTAVETTMITGDRPAETGTTSRMTAAPEDATVTDRMSGADNEVADGKATHSTHEEDDATGTQNAITVTAVMSNEGTETAPTTASIGDDNGVSCGNDGITTAVASTEPTVTNDAGVIVRDTEKMTVPRRNEMATRERRHKETPIAVPTTTRTERPRRQRAVPPPVTRRSARIHERGRRRVHFIDDAPPMNTEVRKHGENTTTASGSAVVDTVDTKSSSEEEKTEDDAAKDGTPAASLTTAAAASLEPTCQARMTGTEVRQTAMESTTARTSTTSMSPGTTMTTGITVPGVGPRTRERSDGELAELMTTAVPVGGTSQTAAGHVAIRRQTTETIPEIERSARTTAKPGTTATPAASTACTRTTGIDGTEIRPRTAEEPTTTNAVDVRNVPHASATGGRQGRVLTDTNDDDGTVQEASTLQLTDTEIIEAQDASKFVKRALAADKYRGMKVETRYGLVVIETSSGWRVLLPPTIWAVVFKEMHGSIWAGHLRGPHTYGRVAQLYWWPKLRKAVNQWIRGCPECGSRKARPREVIPPLRSIRGGDVGDRWALDVAGPFPAADDGERFVIAAVEYVTRYAVARCVPQHTAEDIATFLMEDVVLKFGCFRELLTDGAPELTSSSIDVLMTMLQAHQTNAVAYRPQMIGLVERFHRTWKDCVAVFMQDEAQKDWNLWVRFATYAYNSARHSTVLLTPNELMMGRKLRSPNELLRRTAVTEAGELTAYHEQLLAAMKRAQQCAERARIREQERQARYYNRNARTLREFRVNDRVWLYNPPRGPKATKFVHQWIGPMRIMESVGYDNFRLRREDRTGATEEMIAHVSFLSSYYEPESPLSEIADDIDEQLRHENAERHDETAAAPVRATTAVERRRTTKGSGKRSRTPMGGTPNDNYTGGQLVEQRRRRRRNKAGHYVLEYLLFPIGDPRQWTTTDREQWTTADGQPKARWVSMSDYERYYTNERVVEDPWEEEDV